MNKNRENISEDLRIKAYLINLKRDCSKRQKMISILNNLKINFSIIDAVDATEKNHLNFDGYNIIKRKLFLGRELIDKEIAIMNSHVKAINTFLNSREKFGLFLEDDIEIPFIFVDILKKISLIQYKWDVIRFINKPKFLKLSGRKVIRIDSCHFLTRLPKLPGGGYAYLITKSGAEKLIKMTRNYYHPIDILMGQTWKTNLNSLFCSPGIINHPPVPDEIEINDPRYIKEKKDLLSIYFFSRFFYKLYEALMKWSFYYLKLPSDWIALNKTKKNFKY